MPVRLRPRIRDAKLRALADEPEFAGLRMRHLLSLAAVLDRGHVRCGATIAAGGGRVLQPMIVSGGAVLVDGVATCPPVAVGLGFTDSSRVATATVTALSALQVWFVEPRAVRHVLGLVPELRSREVAA